MTANWEGLAGELASLGEKEQRAVLERVAELNYRRGLAVLSEQYRVRLQSVARLDQSAEEVLAELRRIREEIAAGDYPR